MWPDPSPVNPEWLSTINGIDFTLFLAVVLVVVGWLGDREKLVRCLRAVEDRADHWTKRCIEAQAEVERLCASVAAEVEARLDAEVEARLEGALPGAQCSDADGVEYAMVIHPERADTVPTPAIDAFRKHLDGCKRCEQQPFNPRRGLPDDPARRSRCYRPRRATRVEHDRAGGRRAG